MSDTKTKQIDDLIDSMTSEDLLEYTKSRAKMLEQTVLDVRAEKVRRAEMAALESSAPAHVGRPVDSEFKEFCRPGSGVTEYWVRPKAEQIVGKASNLLETKAYLTTDTAPATSGAGYWFTDELYRQIVMGIQDASGVLEADPTIVITNHLRDIQIPVLSVDAVATAGVEGSDATATETDGSAVTLGKFRYDGKFSVSAETIMAAEYGVDELMATYASRAVANRVAEMLAMGDGTTEPGGAFVESTLGTTAASQTAVTAKEMLEFTKTLSKGYRKTARLVVSDALHTQMLEWTDDNGAYLLRSLEGGGYTFAGKPVFLEPQADQGGVSAAEVHAVYGDFSGMIIRMSPMLFHKDDSNPLVVVYRFAIWLDSLVADANALVHLKTHA